jgi:hypothetical protein
MEIKLINFRAGRLRKLLQGRFASKGRYRDPKILENCRTEFDFLWQELIPDGPRINYATGSFQINNLGVIRRITRCPDILRVRKDLQKRCPALEINFKSRRYLKLAIPLDSC